MMTENNDFLTLVEKAMRIQGRSHMRPVIEKELLHYDILFALDTAGLLDKLTFQGGTALRLCYGSQRFSEDLDFAGGYDFQTQDLMSIKSCLENYLTERYGLEITVKEPKDFLLEPEERNIKVSKWQIRLVTHPERKDIPKQMIKLEIANIPAYTRTPRPLLYNYDFLPDGYSNTLVMVETLDEIVADKVVAFVNCQKHVRYRDIWDLHWLKQQGAKINNEFINNKIKDYKIEHYEYKVQTMTERLPSIIQSKEFKAQMSRFLPMDIQERTILNEKYCLFLQNEIVGLLKSGSFMSIIWEIGDHGEIYCSAPMVDLSEASFENTIITFGKALDKNGLLLVYGKRPSQLIISPSDEWMARKICDNPIYKHNEDLKEGYMVDQSLPPGRWMIKFVDI